MSAISKESVSQEVAVEVACEMEDGLVEVGAVSETKGGPFGVSPDNGNGWQLPASFCPCVAYRKWMIRLCSFVTLCNSIIRLSFLMFI